MPQVDWLDRLTFREVELINEQEKKATKQMYLMIEFPRFEHLGHQVWFYSFTGLRWLLRNL